jgi:hypothetical protein
LAYTDPGKHKEYNREYRKKNRERLREYHREYQREYWERNRDRLGEARREYMREYRANNPDQIREYQRKYREARRARQPAHPEKDRPLSKADLRAFSDRLKDAPCTDCGGRFPPEAMDWDHLPERAPKIGSVSLLVSQGRPTDVILAEIAKCELVCSNCHRVRTYRRKRCVA